MCFGSCTFHSNVKSTPGSTGTFCLDLEIGHVPLQRGWPTCQMGPTVLAPAVLENKLGNAHTTYKSNTKLWAHQSCQGIKHSHT